MAKWNNFYLVRIQFLGFRYHGWQIQPDVKSVEGMVTKTFPFVLGHDNFKIIGCGRTDAKVSAEDFVFELFINEELNEAEFLESFNSNLPFDIRAKHIEKTDATFNIIQHPKIKEYHYHFSFGNKTHPFNAPFIINIANELNVKLMKEGAKCFEGTHNFKRFTTRAKESDNFEREILSCSIGPNNQYKGNFFPQSSYTFKISSKGFLRYQVRMMMGALIELGKENITLNELKNYLSDFEGESMNQIAPSSGLVLHKVTL